MKTSYSILFMLILTALVSAIMGNHAMMFGAISWAILMGVIIGTIHLVRKVRKPKIVEVLLDQTESNSPMQR